MKNLLSGMTILLFTLIFHISASGQGSVLDCFHDADYTQNGRFGMMPPDCDLNNHTFKTVALRIHYLNNTISPP